MQASCSICKTGAIYKSPYSGLAFCAKCFKKNVEDRVRSTINRYKLFTPNDKVLAAVSGGKDSTILLRVLVKVESRWGVEVMALTIDEGIGGYRAEGIERAKRLAEGLCVPHYVATFKEEYGYALEEAYSMASRRGSRLHACTLCGVLRRRLINLKAKELGATKVATGHNLDDEAQTALINILRGNIARLARLGVKPMRQWEGFVPRVKPLRYVPEKEIALYAYLSEVGLYEEECKFIEGSMRHEVRRMLNKLDNAHPGIKYAIVSAADRLARLIEEKVRGEVKACKYCGEPTGRELCRACEVLEELGVL
ncbi:MAG: TIGR00269 family protein [Candidatus Nezhaarchaeota archaeon]|nr:TIGR00269 family protein [Candidatus Nezhaarchaeota archaeon]